MTEALKQKLKELPKEPGVYFHKDKSGAIIYIGKASVLSNRVRHYFQKTKNRDPKTEALVAEIHDTDWVTVDSEIDALFLEAEMIRRYMPPYNILLRDDKSLSYVRINIKSDHPTVIMTRRPLDDGAEYYGPYINSFHIKKALRLLRRVFPFATTEAEATMGSKLYEQIGLDPGVASGRTSLAEYRKSLRLLGQYLRGDKKALTSSLEKQMKAHAKNQEFELAAYYRNQLNHLLGLRKQIIFSDREFMDLSKDMGLSELADLLGYETPPRRIEGFDISHMSGTDTVASMVVFVSGMPDKASYRKFKMNIPGNDDFAHMFEVISRRLSSKNVKNWGMPDLFLIDGGKGQLGSALRASTSLGKDVAMVGLAKQYEQVVISKQSAMYRPELYEKITALKGTYQETDEFILIDLPESSHVVKLLQRIRDESHRFAVSYHTTLKQNRQTKSWLDEVPGIGPQTKKKLIKTFGSTRAVLQARDDELVHILGDKKAHILRQYIRAEKKYVTS